MISITIICFAVLYSTVLVFNVAGNSLVIFIISTNKVQRSATNYLLLNMAIADLIIGVFASQRYIVHPFLSPENQLNLSCLFSLIETTGWIAAAASMVTMVMLSFERYYAVCHPLKFRRVFTKTNIKLLIAATWMYGLLTNMHSFVHSKCRHPSHTTPQNIYDALVWVYFIEGVVFFTIMISLVIKIIRTLFWSNRIAAEHLPNQASLQIRDQKRKKITRAALLVIITFIICWIPEKSLCLLSAIQVNNTDVFHYGFTVSGVLVSINASLDPYLFSFQGSCFASYLKKIVCCACCEKNRVISIENTSTTRRSEVAPGD